MFKHRQNKNAYSEKRKSISHKKKIIELRYACGTDKVIICFSRIHEHRSSNLIDSKNHMKFLKTVYKYYEIKAQHPLISWHILHSSLKRLRHNICGLVYVGMLDIQMIWVITLSVFSPVASTVKTKSEHNKAVKIQFKLWNTNKQIKTTVKKTQTPLPYRSIFSLLGKTCC